MEDGYLDIDITELLYYGEYEFIIFPGEDDCYIEFAAEDVTLTIAYLDYAPIFD